MPRPPCLFKLNDTLAKTGEEGGVSAQCRDEKRFGDTNMTDAKRGKTLPDIKKDSNLAEGREWDAFEVSFVLM